MTPAVFLDRDGTLIEEVNYLDSLERIDIFPWTIDALRLLRRGGFRLVVITNQAGIARGFFKEAFVRRAHEHLDATLAKGGAGVDRYYYCPHHPQAVVPEYRQACGCRKPQAGMLHQAERELDLDLSRSVLVGDRWSDIGAAYAAGLPGVLVRTGYGRAEEAQPDPATPPAAVVDDLMSAATWILGR